MSRLNYISLKQGMFIRISLLRQNDIEEFHVHEVENGMQRIYKCVDSLFS